MTSENLALVLVPAFFRARLEAPNSAGLRGAIPVRMSVSFKTLFCLLAIAATNGIDVSAKRDA